MRRLFVAIRPPAAARAALLAIMGGISGARWQTEAQLHVTLRFIGAVDRHVAQDVDAALAGVAHPAFDMRLSGLGTFERRGRQEVVWAGVSPAEPVRTLHNKVDQALARVGLPPDRRAFAPHVTLGRLGRSAGPVGAFLSQAGDFSTAPFRVARFHLYESQLMPDGAVYTALADYPLLGPG
jgi:RNA 2',3'-cyclic 3'-phosphodiesterase